MRYATVVLKPVSGGLHPADRAVAEDSDLSREAINHLNRLTDGTGVMIYHIRGDPEKARRILEDQQDVKSWDLSVVDDGIHVYVHFEPDQVISKLLRLTHEHELVLDLPIECTTGGGLRVTAIGEDETFQEVIAEIPDDIHVELVEMGEYKPEHQRLRSLLTDRQREILEVAVEAGYYEEPRQVTYEDIAERVELSPATVGEHLRKIEGKTLRELSR